MKTSPGFPGGFLLRFNKVNLPGRWRPVDDGRNEQQKDALNESVCLPRVENPPLIGIISRTPTTKRWR